MENNEATNEITSEAQVEETINVEEPSEQEAVPETTQEKVARLKKFKVNGQELEFNLDDDNSTEELIKLAQLGGGARAKMQEAAEIKKLYDQMERMSKENPEEFLRSRGLDPESLAEEIIMRKIQEMEKSPEQLEREKISKELEDERKLRKQLEEEKMQARVEKLQIEYLQDFNKQITSALDEYKSLPKSQYTVKRIANTMLTALDNGIDVSVQDVIPYVHKEIQSEIQQLIESLPEEFIEEFIGKRSVERMRQSRLKKMDKPKVATKVEHVGSDESEPKTPVKKMSYRDFFGN
jgi:hypothetical protein